MLPILILIFIFGLLFGSLSTVLVERWHSGKWGILMGRSECPKCRHRLWASELIPLFSYIFQKWECKHCSIKIPVFYPLSELLMASIFVLLSYSYLENWGIPFSLSHFVILAMGFVTGVYMLYDLRYMEIPDQIIVPGIYLYALFLIWALYFTPIESLFFDRSTYTGNIADFVLDHFTAAWILYSFFYLQILLPGGWYLIKKRRIRHLFELLFSYFLFPFILLFTPSGWEKTDDNEEIPTWIGWGDLRIALFIGLSLGIIHSIVSFGIAYIVGSIFGIIYLIVKGKSETLQNQVPFGPFLAIGWLVSIFYHEEILNIVKNLIDINSWY